ncbi:MAG: nucleotidyltransferase domain-containing protein [Clostridiales bacterium]|nr:nucleotidyltransferase domain-containing protein [Clostridiales bacterium]
MASDIISLEEIKEKIVPILRDYPVDKAIVFGSYAKGNAVEGSDIDLYIDTNGKLKGLDFAGLIEVLINAVEMDIDLFDRSHIIQDSQLMKEIENGGVVIYEKSKDYSKDN